MNPQTFLQKYEAHQEVLDAQPTREESFQTAQFTSMKKEITAASDALQAFLKRHESTVTVKNLSELKIQDVVKAIKALEKALKPVADDNTDLISAIRGIDLKPTYSPKITVSPTPVHVAAPTVNVPEFKLDKVIKAIADNKPEKVDNSELIQLLRENLSAIKAVKKAVDTKPTPVANTPTDPLIAYAPADIDDASGVQYFGYTQNSGNWYIRRFDTTASPKTLRFVFGQYDYSTKVGTIYPTAWGTRASLTYTIWGT